MIHVQKYCGKRVKDGSEVRGYAAIGYESKAAWIMVPVEGKEDQFTCMQVKPDSIVPLC